MEVESSTPTVESSVPASPRGFVGSYLRRTFSSLALRNYRLYFIGQGISLTGTWMQGLAQGWLVATLTKSPMMVGLVASMQFLPVLFLAPYGGVLADRLPKRRVLVVTQTAAAILALILGTLAATHLVQLWMIFVLAGCLGVINSLDNPTRQAFVHELVGGDQLRNAVTLNSLEVNLMRIVGPALAGVVIVAIGLPLCFIVNAVSFIGVIVCLLMMRVDELNQTGGIRSAKGQLREGLAYVRETPLIRDVLIMMGLVGMLTYEFAVTLLNLAKFTFHTNALGPASLTSMMGVGAVVGGLLTAGRKTSPLKSLTLSSFGFGISVLVLAFSPTIHFAALVMIAVGIFSLMFTSLTNTILQLESAPEMRGRVMSLWSVGFLGSTAIGAPVVGCVAEKFGPRPSIALGAAAALIAGLVGLSALRRHRDAAPSAVVEQPSVAEKEDFV